MNFGVNTFVWVSPFTTASIYELAPKVKHMGFDTFEISMRRPAIN